jgi:hypothetical protein
VTNTTGSTISLLKDYGKESGVYWRVTETELIPPKLNDEHSWKRSYVYGFDTFEHPDDPDHTWVFYNARNGWKHAVESVGVSRFSLKAFDGDKKESE